MQPNSTIRACGRRPSAAFTLIELVIAISIAAGIALILWQTYARTFEIKERLEQVNDVHHYGRLLVDRLARELKSAFIIRTQQDKPYSYFIGKEEGENSSVAFTCFTSFPHVSAERKGDQVEIHYFTEREPATDLYALKTTRSSYIDGNFEEGGTTNTLLENLRSFKLEYYDRERDDYQDEWDSRNDQKDRLPQAVRIRIELEDENKRSFPFSTLVSLPLANARPGEPVAGATPTPTPTPAATPKPTPTPGTGGGGSNEVEK